MGTAQKKYLAKVLFIGSYAVGKTSVRRRWCGQKFEENYLATIGVDFSILDIELSENVIWKLNLWDVAGQASYHSVTRSFLTHPNGVIVVFDVTREDTKQSIFNWLERVYNENRHIDHPIPVLVLGNKTDLIPGYISDFSNYSTFNLQDYDKIDYSKLDYIPTSAKSGENLGEAFNILVEKLHQNQLEIEKSIG
jgi:small GTP-binding protein